MSVFRICCALFGACLAAVGQEAWYRGAFYVPEVPDPVALEGLGQGQLNASAQYLPGGIRLAGSEREDVFLVGSNRLAFYYTTPGELTVERFEQYGKASPDQSLQSRMILHITEGALTVDSSALSENSQCVVETPLGRLNAGSGVWSLYITYDVRTRIYNFTLESLDLELTFKTHSGEHFVVQAGQMLTGAGASTLPDLEVSDLLNSAQDRVEVLERSIEETRESLSTEQLADKLSPIVNRNSIQRTETAVVPSGESASGVRPIIIEYSPRPKPLVPFRGVVRPPSEYQKDLF